MQRTRISFGRQWIRAGLWVAIAIHWLPLPGLLGADSLRTLYALAASIEPAVELLLQHRALLFALLSLPLAFALNGRGSLRAGCALLLASDIAFALLCLQRWPLSPALQRVLLFDVASIALLLIGLAATAPSGDQTLRR
ncbi:hypothetical protein [Aquimonas voraii]|uniref:Uncharacterized protein n=1 Tax=Aquimonas voraii TaxID=265719 RepID=A0A1G6U7S3_9GAMM|nr:hypothetical protein [Aquimonas voraii]SDD36615.1 hypothetical protein SAMN04488509_102176 [Aquimonas voraii]